MAIQSDDDIAVGTSNSLLLRVGSGGLGPVAGTPGAGTNFGQPVTALAVQSDDDIAVGLTAPSNGQLLLREGSGGLGPAAGSPPGGTVFSHGVTSLASFYLPSLGLEGDYNGDQVVNAADFTIWSDGQSPDSSAAGYALWADNFNNSAGSTSAGAVPEPTALLLALLGLAALLLRVPRG